MINSACMEGESKAARDGERGRKRWRVGCGMQGSGERESESESGEEKERGKEGGRVEEKGGNVKGRAGVRKEGATHDRQ